MRLVLPQVMSHSPQTCQIAIFWQLSSARLCRTGIRGVGLVDVMADMGRRRRTRRLAAALMLALTLGSCSHGGQQTADTLTPPSYQLTLPIPPRTPKPVAPPQALAANVAALGANFQGKLGIAVSSVDQGWTVQSNGDTRLPQQSVSKLWVAMTVLDFRDAGRLRLEDPVTIRREDLTFFPAQWDPKLGIHVT